MKTILRKTSFNALSLFAVSQVVSGLKIEGGLQTYLFAGLALSVLSFIVKPILTILTLPLNLATLGAFSFITNALILYLLTIIVPQIVISGFVFQGLSFLGFVIPKISFNVFFAYIICAFLLYFIVSFINWLIK